MTLKNLFFIFFKIGGLTLGGGYVMMPIIEEEIVHKRKWIAQQEFVNILAVAQSFPGALAVNTAIYVGYKLRGKKGAFVSCLGVILPPFLIITLAAAFLMENREKPWIQGFFRGVRPAVAGLIVAAVIRLSKGVERTWVHLAVAVCAFIFVAFLKIHPAFVILISGSMGASFFVWKGRGNHGNPR